MSQTTFYIQDSADISVDDFGTQVFGVIGGNLAEDHRYYGLLRFDTSGIPSPEKIVVSSAILRVYLLSNDVAVNGLSFRVYRQKRAWTTDATSQIYSTGNSWQTVGGVGADDVETDHIGRKDMNPTETLGWHEISLAASLVQEQIRGTWTENSYMIRYGTVTYKNLKTFDNEAGSYPPELVLTYTIGNSLPPIWMM